MFKFKKFPQTTDIRFRQERQKRRYTVEGKACHPWNQKEHSCKVLQQTPGLQPLWEMFGCCQVVPLTAVHSFSSPAVPSTALGELQNQELASLTLLVRTDRITASIAPNHSAWPVSV